MAEKSIHEPDLDYADDLAITIIALAFDKSYNEARQKIANALRRVREEGRLTGRAETTQIIHVALCANEPAKLQAETQADVHEEMAEGWSL